MIRRPAPRWPAMMVATGVALAVPGATSAALLRVPTDLPTVRAAVDSAASGDTVLIAPGVHAGGVYVKGKVITLTSWFVLTGDTSYVAATVLDSVIGNPCPDQGCAGDAVVEFKQADGSAVIGLTLQHGTDGVRSYSVVDLSFCRILANADGMDYQSGSGGLIRGNLFAHNTDDGIDINGRTSVRVIGNVSRNNHQDGVEFRLYPYVGPMLTTEFIGNTFSDNGGDGIQLIDYPDTSSRVVRIERNLFARNGDAAIGCMPDGITSEDFSGAPIAERVFLIGNTFLDSRYGLSGGANVIALNNLFAGTEEIALWRMGGSSIAAYCLFWDNEQDAQESNLGGQILHADPELEDDGSLEPDSPAIDAGTDHFVWEGETVLDLPPSSYAGAKPDLGAFEIGLPRPDGNLAPRVQAGSDQIILQAAAARLGGGVSDDWLPMPSSLGVQWTLASGPGPVTFANPNACRTHATFVATGRYILRLAASDGVLGASDTMAVTVEPNPPPGVVIVERRIGSASDDQEETATGTISPNTGDIEMVLGPTIQKVGLRFSGVGLPPGATITRAWMQFESDEVQSEPTLLLVQGQADDDPGTFTLLNLDVSLRPRTLASTAWIPPPWNVEGEQGADERTPDLAAIVQEIVDRPGWASGNAMAFIITGTGHRTARSYEGDSTGAALLHIEAMTAVAGVGDSPGGALALHGITPNPSRGALRVDLSLAPGGPASLELMDIAGRRIAARDLTAFAPGSHGVELREALPAGVYLVRLAQNGRVRSMKAVVLH